MARITPETREEILLAQIEGKTVSQIARERKVTYVTILTHSPNYWEVYDITTRSGWQEVPGATGKLSVAEAKAYLAEKYKGINMADRKFEETRRLDGGITKYGSAIKCSNCGATSEFFNSRGVANPVHAASVFRNRGWIVAGGPRADECPECQRKRREKMKAQPAAPLTPLPSTVTQQLAPPKPPVPVAPPKKAEEKPFKDATREDRRIIQLKLEDPTVYDIDDGGYQGQWSDQRVAEDLNCPVLWVETIRDLFIGPNTSRVDAAKEMEELKALAAKVLESRNQINALVERLTSLDKTFNETLTRFEKENKDFQTKYNSVMTKKG